MRPPHEPTDVTRAQVKALAQFITQRDIAIHIGVDEKTLRKHYRAELDEGMVRSNLAVLQNLQAFASGRKGTEKAQVTAAIFWGKTRAGLRETVDHNVRHDFVDGARERLAGKLGGAVPPVREEGEAAFPAPVGTA